MLGASRTSGEEPVTVGGRVAWVGHVQQCGLSVGGEVTGRVEGGLAVAVGEWRVVVADITSIRHITIIDNILKCGKQS